MIVNRDICIYCENHVRVYLIPSQKVMVLRDIFVFSPTSILILIF